MSSDKRDAIEAFERLGLTTYEAQVFIALHRLGVGTAREIADTTNVPRSQVYSTAEQLEEKGLLNIQQSNPLRYRPVGIDEAQQTLRKRFEGEQEKAFNYVETVKDDDSTEEEQEEIWTVRGSDRVDIRVVDILSNATERIVFGVHDPTFITEDIEQSIRERAAEGLDVTVISNNPAIRNQFDEVQGVVTSPQPANERNDDLIGRTVFADDDCLLLSVISGSGDETAIWSLNSTFAAVVIQLAEAETDATKLNNHDE